MNQFVCTGNLGNDCEVRQTQSGMSICNFSIAVKSGYGDNQKTTWIRCTLFGKRAESKLIDYLKKGTQVCLSGEISLNEWEKDGVTRSTLELNVDNLDLIGGKSRQNSENNHVEPVDTGATTGELPF